MSNRQEEQRLGKFYELLVSEDKKEKLFLPADMKKEDLVNYVQNMIQLNQPRFERKEGRKHDINAYKIPTNYAVIDSNLVNYNSSLGVVVDNPDDSDVLTNLNRIRQDDLGAVLLYHIFKHGRRTIEELLGEMTGYDRMMLTLLINRMLADGYLRVMDEEEDDGRKIKTLELVEKEENPEIDYKKAIKAADFIIENAKKKKTKTRSRKKKAHGRRV